MNFYFNPRTIIKNNLLQLFYYNVLKYCIACILFWLIGTNVTQAQIYYDYYINNARTNGYYSQSSAANFEVDAANVTGGRFIVNTSGNVGININNPSDRLHVNGLGRFASGLKIDGTNTLEFGFGVAGKEVSAGKIGYQTFTSGALDIVGAGTSGTNRKIKLWAEGGLFVNGDVAFGNHAPESHLHITSGNFITGITDDNSYLKLGDSNAGHILMDYEKIQMKVNANTAGNLLINPFGGNVGIGTASPGSFKLDVLGTGASDWVTQFKNSTYNTGIHLGGRSGVGIIGTIGASKISINPDGGNVGIGTTSPNALLQLNNSIANRKIVLYEGANNDHQYYGFGINAAVLRYQTDNTGADHVFYAAAGATSSNELMRIKGNGNIGIGTPSPGTKLEVAGQVKITGGSPGAGKVLTSDASGLASWTAPATSQWGTTGSNIHFSTGNVGIGTTTPYAPLQFSSTEANRKIVLYTLPYALNDNDLFSGFGTNTNGGLRYQVANQLRDHVFYAGYESPFLKNPKDTSGTSLEKSLGISTELLRIKGDGNVGIGTPSPGAKLEVAGQVKITGGNPGAGKVLTSDASGLASWTIPASTLWAANGNDINYSVGNVGIGIATPTKGKLQVVGSLHVENEQGQQTFHVSAGKQLVFVGDSAWIQYQNTLGIDTSAIQKNNFSLWVSKGVVSENYVLANISDWDDYVFNENYDLPTLKKVAAFVKANRHLPNIPSEADVKKNGYDLHQMNRDFLKTMEEMTLYAIEQDKKIDALEAKVNTLETKVQQYEQLAGDVEKLKAMLAELKK